MNYFYSISVKILILRFKKLQVFKKKIYLLMHILVKMRWQFLTLKLNQKSHKQCCALSLEYYGAAYILLPAVMSSSMATVCWKMACALEHPKSKLWRQENLLVSTGSWMDRELHFIPWSSVHTNTNNTWLWKSSICRWHPCYQNRVALLFFLHLSENDLNSARIIKKEAGEIIYVINK